MKLLLHHTFLAIPCSNEDLLTTVKQHKLKWYRLVTRSTGLAKKILQGTEYKKDSRQKKRWEDNIPEWTGMTLGAAMGKAERWEEWRELVARSSVAPQRSTRLRDRLRWWSVPMTPFACLCLWLCQMILFVVPLSLNFQGYRCYRSVTQSLLANRVWVCCLWACTSSLSPLVLHVHGDIVGAPTVNTQ